MSKTNVLKALVTAGNTLAPIDNVRGITNIFSGRTGAQIALELHRRGHDVVLLTSRPEAINELDPGFSASPRWELISYRYFDELRFSMQNQLLVKQFDILVHSAAVSDYLIKGIYAPVPGTRFNEIDLLWESQNNSCQLTDIAAGKVKGNHEEVWLRLVKAPKLVDQVRSPWGFQGRLVKFKLEVGVDISQLETIAEASRLHSNADLMVANSLEGMHEWAILGPIHGQYQQVRRAELARRLVDILEAS